MTGGKKDHNAEGESLENYENQILDLTRKKVRKKIGKLTDLLASTNRMFSDAANERAILCLTTSGHS